MSRYFRKIFFAFLAITCTNLNSASGQEAQPPSAQQAQPPSVPEAQPLSAPEAQPPSEYDRYRNRVLPEWLEGYGYKDAHTFEQPGSVSPGQAKPRPDLTGATPGPCDSQASCHCLLCRHGWSGCLPENSIIYRGRVTQFFYGVGGGVVGPVAPPFAALGISPGNTFAYTGNSRHDLLFNLDKFGWLPGSKFIFTAENIWGRFGNVGLSSGALAPVVGALLPLDFETTGIPRLTNLFYVQPISENLIVGTGKLRFPNVADQNIFAGGDGSDQFSNQAFASCPLFPAIMPICAFAVTTSMPQEWGSISFNVIDPQDRTLDYFEFTDGLFSQGVILHGEIKVDTNLFGMPGEQHIGGAWKHGDMLDLRISPVPPEYTYPPSNPNPPVTIGLGSKTNSSIIYYGFDQYLQVFEGSGAVPKGWGLFGRASIADGGTGNPNFRAWSVQTGFGGDSLLACRRKKGDRWGIGYNYTATSTEWGVIPNALFGPRNEQDIEMYYRYQVTPFMQITGDVQYVRGVLGGLTNGGDAVIGGIRVNLTF